MSIQIGGPVTPVGLMTRLRGLPVISWLWPQQHSAGAGAGCGLVGGACCVGGAAVKGFGLASAASVSTFVADATPYFIAASVIGILVWAAWLFQKMGRRVRAFAPVLFRQGAVMGIIYGITLGGTTLIASAAGISM